MLVSDKIPLLKYDKQVQTLQSMFCPFLIDVFISLYQIIESIYTMHYKTLQNGSWHFGECSGSSYFLTTLSLPDRGVQKFTRSVVSAW